MGCHNWSWWGTRRSARTRDGCAREDAGIRVLTVTVLCCSHFDFQVVSLLYTGTVLSGIKRGTWHTRVGVWTCRIFPKSGQARSTGNAPLCCRLARGFVLTPRLRTRVLLMLQRSTWSVTSHAPVESGVGYCNVTPSHHYSDCSEDDKGSFPWQGHTTWPAATAACRKSCLACSRCQYISVSLRWRDCSWYRSCELSRLQTATDGFRSEAVIVRGTENAQNWTAASRDGRHRARVVYSFRTVASSAVSGQSMPNDSSDVHRPLYSTRAAAAQVRCCFQLLFQPHVVHAWQCTAVRDAYGLRVRLHGVRSCRLRVCLARVLRLWLRTEPRQGLEVVPRPSQRDSARWPHRYDAWLTATSQAAAASICARFAHERQSLRAHARPRRNVAESVHVQPRPAPGLGRGQPRRALDALWRLESSEMAQRHGGCGRERRS